MKNKKRKRHYLAIKTKTAGWSTRFLQVCAPLQEVYLWNIHKHLCDHQSHSSLMPSKMGTEIVSFKKIRDQKRNSMDHLMQIDKSSRPCKTSVDSTEFLKDFYSLHHTTESHILVSLQLQCTRNGQRTVQLPELSPGPAGPETHLEYQDKDEGLREHSTVTLFFTYYIIINLPLVDTGISHPFVPTFWHHFGSSGSFWLVLTWLCCLL